jgi:hypothetical protein
VGKERILQLTSLQYLPGKPTTERAHLLLELHQAYEVGGVGILWASEYSSE